MDWLSIGSSVLGAVGNLWSANNANDMQRQNLESQMAFNREVMQNRHQWEVQDLRQSGLNPLMSVTSPTGTLSSPSAPAAQKADISNSALALGQLQIADKQAEAQLLSAKANAKNADTAFEAMQNENRNISSQIRAREVQNETSWLMVNSQVENAKSQTDLNKALTTKTWLENNYLPRMYEANLNEIQTRIANSIAETAAKIQLMDRQGRAALTNANAYAMFVNTMEENGISVRALNYAKADELRNNIQIVGREMDLKEGRFNYEKELHLPDADLAHYKHELFIGPDEENGHSGSAIGSSAYRLGRMVSDLVGLSNLFGFIK